MNRWMRALTSTLLVLVLAGLLGLAALQAVPGLPDAFRPAPPAAPSPTHDAGSEPALPPASATALPPLPGDAPRPEAAALRRALDKAFDGRGGVFHASVVDVSTGDPLYDRDASARAVPASSLKVATAAAALSVLGADSTLRTAVVRASEDSVVLVGGGDVLLGAGRSGESVVGRAGLRTLAASTAAALLEDADGAAPPADGEKRRALRVLLDDSLFTGAALSPVWDESLVATSNIAAVQPVALYGARKDSAPGSPRVGDPALTAARTFRTLLAAELAERQGGSGGPAGGLRVARGVERGPAGEGAPELASVESAPVREQLRHMSEASDNYVAEAMGRLVALGVGKPASFGGAAEAVKEAVARMGVDTSGMALADASGLARASRISPAQLAGVLRAAATSPDADLRELTYLLPIAGATGTLESRLDGDATRGLVRAKTGTLAGVATLTGSVVTADGRLLVFSFFAHDVPGSLKPARAALDRAATVLAGCGCR